MKKRQQINNNFKDILIEISHSKEQKQTKDFKKLTETHGTVNNIKNFNTG